MTPLSFYNLCIERFTPTLCCTSSSDLSLQVVAVARTVGNGLRVVALVCREPLVLHSLSSVRKATTCFCSLWTSWSFHMSSVETTVRECDILSCVSIASYAHFPLPRSSLRAQQPSPKHLGDFNPHVSRQSSALGPRAADTPSCLLLHRFQHMRQEAPYAQHVRPRGYVDLVIKLTAPF